MYQIQIIKINAATDAVIEMTTKSPTEYSGFHVVGTASVWYSSECISMQNDIVETRVLVSNGGSAVINGVMLVRPIRYLRYAI